MKIRRLEALTLNFCFLQKKNHFTFFHAIIYKKFVEYFCNKKLPERQFLPLNNRQSIQFPFILIYKNGKENLKKFAYQSKSLHLFVYHPST